jgi:hypothetical protein
LAQFISRLLCSEQAAFVLDFFDSFSSIAKTQNEDFGYRKRPLLRRNGSEKKTLKIDCI